MGIRGRRKADRRVTDIASHLRRTERLHPLSRHQRRPAAGGALWNSPKADSTLSGPARSRVVRLERRATAAASAAFGCGRGRYGPTPTLLMSGPASMARGLGGAARHCRGISRVRLRTRALWPDTDSGHSGLARWALGSGRAARYCRGISRVRLRARALWNPPDTDFAHVRSRWMARGSCRAGSGPCTMLRGEVFRPRFHAPLGVDAAFSIAHGLPGSPGPSNGRRLKANG
jgi:hypothetical protein